MKQGRKLIAILMVAVLLITVNSQSVMAETVTEPAQAAATVQNSGTKDMQGAVQKAPAATSVQKPGEKAVPATPAQAPGSAVDKSKTAAGGQAPAAAATDKKTQPEKPAVTSDLKSSSTNQQPVKDAAKTADPAPVKDSAASEKKADENQPVEVKAEQYNKTPITGTGESNGVSVYVTVPKGSFPDGTTLAITPMSNGMVSELTDASDAVAFDITFTDANGNKVQPQNGQMADVTFTANSGSALLNNADGANLSVYHYGSNGAEKMASKAAPAEGSSASLTFKASSFSPYVITRADAPILRSPSRGGTELQNVAITSFEITKNDGVSADTYYTWQNIKTVIGWDASSYGTGIHAGDYFRVQLLPEITVLNGSPAASFDVPDPDGNIVGHAQIVDNLITVTFTDYVETHSNIRGTMYVASNIAGAVSTYTVTYSNIPLAINGAAAEYSIKEDTITGYTASADSAANGGTITNSHELEKTTISGKKIWEDNNNQDGARPESITIRLLANGQEVQQKSVSARDGWEYSFDNLLAYDERGRITYTLSEDAIENYSSEPNGFDFTNTHAPGKTSVAVTKSWSDKNNRDKKRPDSVTIHLFADGVDTQKTLTLNENGGWVGSFTDLDIYSNGKAIKYTITEDRVNGYSTVIVGDALRGFTVVNSRPSGGGGGGGHHDNPPTPNDNGSGAVSLYKVDAQTGDSLAGAEFVLYKADGTKVGSYTTDSQGYIKVQNLRYGSYYFTETKAPDGYHLDQSNVKFTLDKSNSADNSHPWNIKVSNTKKDIPTVTIEGTKAWEDNDNAAGKRPESITLHLLANGKEVATVQTSKSQDWKYHFGKQPVNDSNGKAIVYTVTEDAAEGYQFQQEKPKTSDGSMVINVKNTYDIKKPSTIKDNKTPTKVKPTTSVTNKSTNKGKTTTTKAAKSPKTGDNANVMFYLLLLSLASAAMMADVLLFARRKNRKK